VLRQPNDSYQDLTWDPNEVVALLSESQEEKISAATSEAPQTIIDAIGHLIKTEPDVSDIKLRSILQYSVNMNFFFLCSSKCTYIISKLPYRSFLHQL
jgi:hypothetical protein